jgi:hypothetical protein
MTYCPPCSPALFTYPHATAKITHLGDVQPVDEGCMVSLLSNGGGGLYTFLPLPHYRKVGCL